MTGMGFGGAGRSSDHEQGQGLESPAARLSATAAD